MKKSVFIFICFSFLLVFVLSFAFERHAARADDPDTLGMCPGYSNTVTETDPGYSKDINEAGDNECNLSGNQIKISIPFPGLGAATKKYYPVSYQAYAPKKCSGGSSSGKDCVSSADCGGGQCVAGEEIFCYTRTSHECYYVTGLQQYIRLMYMFLVGAIGIVSVGMLVFGGYQYILSQGNPTKIGDAKDTVINSILGLALGLLSYVILFSVNPQITSLSIPLLPPVPSLESGSGAKRVCNSRETSRPDKKPMTCGEFFQTNNDPNNAEWCIGSYCDTVFGAFCLIEPLTTNPHLLANGKCVKSYEFSSKDVKQIDPNSGIKTAIPDGTAVNLDAAAWTFSTYQCTKGTGDTNIDEISVDCNNSNEIDKTCYVVQKDQDKSLVYDGKNERIDPASYRMAGCVRK